MGTFVLKDAFISIDSNDVSSDGNQVNITYEADALEETAFGDDTHIMKGGLKNWSMSFEFNADEADDALGETLFALIGTTVTVAVRPTSAAKGVNNPEYTGTALIQSMTPLQGSVGEMSKVSLSVVSAGTLARATS